MVGLVVADCSLSFKASMLGLEEASLPLCLMGGASTLSLAFNTNPDGGRSSQLEASEGGEFSSFRLRGGERQRGGGGEAASGLSSLGKQVFKLPRKA